MQQFRGTPKLVSTHTELDTATHVQTDPEPHKKGANNVYQFLLNRGTSDHDHSLHGRSSEPSPSGRNKLVVRPKSLATVSGFKWLSQRKGNSVDNKVGSRIVKKIQVQWRYYIRKPVDALGDLCHFGHSRISGLRLYCQKPKG